MISIHSIQFDNLGWNKVEENEQQISFQNPQKPETLTLRYFKTAPEITCALEQIDLLRQAYRLPVAEAGGGLISFDLIQLQKLNCLDAIFKIPQQPRGMSYLGSLTFPFADFSFALRLQCPELGTTGLREAFVVNEYLDKGLLQIDLETQQMIGWAEDPYDKAFNGGNPMNKAEQELYDAQFPEHPLSRVRQIMPTLKQSIKVSAELLLAKPFL
ncbi:MAG: hypothetical protein K2X81_01690 [Candidatus Obscuribacterales bacterium]|nr:hypothetical protein [Candidatus Obscuribacterales bacterium]